MSAVYAVADVVVAALTTRVHVRAALPLTGPVAAEMVAQIGEMIGRPVRFEAMSDDDARLQTRTTPCGSGVDLVL